MKSINPLIKILILLSFQNFAHTEAMGNLAQYPPTPKDLTITTSKDGMLVSESVSFKVWNSNEVSDFTVTKWIEGSSSYQVDGISVASTIETNNVITELNASERVLVKVINVLGQEVNLDDEPFKGTVLFNVYDDGSVLRFVE